MSYSVFKGDRMIWLVVALLSIFSLLVVYSSTVSLAARSASLSPLSFLVKQLLFLAAGFVVLYLTSRLPYTLFMGAAGAGYWLSLGLLALMLAAGSRYNQAVRSLFGFQPAEVAKVMLIVYVAKLLTVHQDSIRESWKKGYIRVLWPVLAVCSLIFLSNFSTAAVLCCTCLIMMFIGRVRVRHLLATLLIAAATLTAALALTRLVDDRLAARKAGGKEVAGLLAMGDSLIGKTRLRTVYGRIFARIGEEEQQQQPLTQSGYAKVAIASSGLLWGKGPGNSTMRYRLPEAFSDFVFAIVVEEYGVLFACIIMLCYLIVLYRVGVMARKATHFFPTLLAIGISTQIMLQALVNMCVSTGIAPVTGQNLPFISQGGSSLIITCVMFGMLLSVSRSQQEEEVRQAAENVARSA